MFKDGLLAAMAQDWSSKVLNCTVAVTAADEGTEVYVTLTLPGAPVRLGPCDWRPRVDGAGAVRLPVRGDDGIIIVGKETKPWLLF